MTRPLGGKMVGGSHGSHGRRFAAHFEAKPDQVRGLLLDHPAVVEGRSIFQHSITAAEDAGRVLVSGANQRKIGNQVTRGAWRGFAIYTLTLEERATCPRSCDHWTSCYGNSMPFARRHRHGEALEIILAAEIRMLARQHPRGFAVRLHVLGDFMSPAYVDLWRIWMEATPELHLFGFTARTPDSPIGASVLGLNKLFPGRCLIRFSGEGVSDAVPRARTIWREPEAPRVAEGIVCPAQTERTDCCGSCGLCWSTIAPIAFIAHGRTGAGRPRKVA
jgi:hypothetical protein